MNESADHATVFELVSDETRLAILRALVEFRRDRGPDEWPTFSELRKRAGVGDASNFNYHLDRLLGRFVEKRDGTYRLTYQGTSVISSLLAGTYGTETDVSLDVDSDCPFCGEPQGATFENGTVTVACEKGHSFTQELPPGTAAERTAREVLSLTALRMWTDAEFVVEGVCSMCYGGLDVRLTDAEGVVGVAHLYVADCIRCGQRFGGPPAMLSLVDPAVVAFYREHGIDLSARPFWTVGFPDHEVEVASESPLRVRVDVRLDGDELRVTMDESASVVRTDRS